MRRRFPIFYSALLLTGVNLLLRLVSTSFQVFLSGRIGPEGIGLLQLVMSVNALAIVAGIAGVRTAAMYLTAEELGKGRPANTGTVLSGCFVYSILCSSVVAAALYFSAPWLAEHWIGRAETLPAIRVLAAFLPCGCLCAVMSGFFTAEGRIGLLAGVQAGEQLCSMLLTLLILTFWAKQDAARACTAVVLGGNLSCCIALCVLVFLRQAERPDLSGSIPIRGRLLRTALPLAAADVVRSGISTTENLLVPRRLALFTGIGSPLAAFGLVSGMVFPVLMFPACILFGLSELLIPELARCAAAGRSQRIGYLVRRGLRTAMLYGLFFSGLLWLIAGPLCLRLYRNAEAGLWLRRYACMVPFLYCDAITDAMTKGLGQQKICVRYNIITSAMDVAGLYWLLPKLGMQGYYISFLVTHLLNFGLSLRRLCIITDFQIPFHLPALGASAVILACAVCRGLSAPSVCVVYPIVLGCLMILFRVVSREDLRWAKGLVENRKAAAEAAA